MFDLRQPQNDLLYRTGGSTYVQCHCICRVICRMLCGWLTVRVIQFSQDVSIICHFYDGNHVLSVPVWEPCMVSWWLRGRRGTNICLVYRTLSRSLWSQSIANGETLGACIFASARWCPTNCETTFPLWSVACSSEETKYFRRTVSSSKWLKDEYHL